ncbi:MAG: hypothetical protein Q4G64_00250 [bacterium]|nr:hypothetical protein [bacterium]
MLEYLAGLLGVVGRALRLEPDALGSETSWAIPLGVIVLAVLSTMVGEAIVLAINKVRGVRLVFTLVYSFVGLLLTYAALAISLWLVGSVVLGKNLAFEPLMQSVMVSAAPYVFGFLVLLPYSGPLVERIIQLWSFASLWAIVVFEFGTERWAALLISAAGTLGMMLASRTLGRPLAWLRDRSWRILTREPLMLSAQEVLDSFPLPEALPPRLPGETREAGGLP